MKIYPSTTLGLIIESFGSKFGTKGSGVHSSINSFLSFWLFLKNVNILLEYELRILFNRNSAQILGYMS
jgi:hypothetical protein